MSSPAEAAEALGGAGPGDTVCLSGDGLRDADLVLARSGVPGRPVVLSGNGTEVASVRVEADHVVVEGVVTSGDGIDLSGEGLVARDNEVRNAALDGISCQRPCAEVLVEDNTVVGTDGTGILVEGQVITVRGNTVSGSIRREAGDADGIRFFGFQVRLLDNIVTDIKDDGYVGEPPHTDCFQTFDNSRPPTVDAVIRGNVCRNVDAQCLIATAQESGEEGAVGRSHTIDFSDNVCDVEGSQAVLVQWVPEVRVRGNSLAGAQLDRGAIFLDGSTNAEFSGNTVSEGVPPYEIDPASTPGFVTDRPR